MQAVGKPFANFKHKDVTVSVTAAFDPARENHQSFQLHMEGGDDTAKKLAAAEVLQTVNDTIDSVRPGDSPKAKWEAINHFETSVQNLELVNGSDIYVSAGDTTKPQNQYHHDLGSLITTTAQQWEKAGGRPAGGKSK